MDGWFSNAGIPKETAWKKRFLVFAEWPWTALMSHDDDRSAIANNLSMAWNDVKSKFVPSNHHEMTLAHVEGPGYDKTQYNGSLSLKSMNADKQSKGGIHPRLVSNLSLKRALSSTIFERVCKLHVPGIIRLPFELNKLELEQKLTSCL